MSLFRIDPLSLLRSVQRFDQRRRGVPGEHWAAASAGTALLAIGRRSRTPVGKALALIGGGLLLWRAASGRDGIARRLRR